MVEENLPQESALLCNTESDKQNYSNQRRKIGFDTKEYLRQFINFLTNDETRKFIENAKSDASLTPYILKVKILLGDVWEVDFFNARHLKLCHSCFIHTSDVVVAQNSCSRCLSSNYNVVKEKLPVINDFAPFCTFEEVKCNVIVIIRLSESGTLKQGEEMHKQSQQLLDNFQENEKSKNIPQRFVGHFLGFGCGIIPIHAMKSLSKRTFNHLRLNSLLDNILLNHRAKDSTVLYMRVPSNFILIPDEMIEFVETLESSGVETKQVFLIADGFEVFNLKTNPEAIFAENVAQSLIQLKPNSLLWLPLPYNSSTQSVIT